MKKFISTGKGRPFRLVTTGRCGVTSQEFSSFEALASAAYGARLAYNYHRYHVGDQPVERVSYQAFGPRGKEIAIHELVRYGARVAFARTAYFRSRIFTWRSGSVPGIGRIGGGSYFRTPKNHAERKQLAAVSHDEVIVRPRGKRSANTLVDSHDDFQRTVQRSWKVQHKGRKSWDRRNRSAGA